MAGNRPEQPVQEYRVSMTVLNVHNAREACETVFLPIHARPRFVWDWRGRGLV